jgi:NAD(P)-dependent dehydrogenase (short-subunit alcohol dehydrogenase family)
VAELRFDGRVAVVTGAGRGLGRSYARLLASRGAKIVVNDAGVTTRGEGSDAHPAEQVVDEIRAAWGDAVACTASVATREGGAAIIDTAIEKYGRIDILIHNAGIFRPKLTKECSLEDYNAVVNVHQHGALHLLQAAFPHMCSAGYGRIVLTSSVLALYGGAETISYSAAKASMIGFCNVLALEGVAEGIKCNIILPGAATRMTGELDRNTYPEMSPEMVAPVVAWLCHERCGVSGEMFIAAGGRVAKAFIAETPGVYQPSWTIEQIADRMAAIRDMESPAVFPVVPDGHFGHIRYNFEMIRHSRERTR